MSFRKASSEGVSAYIGANLELEGLFVCPGKVKFEGRLKGTIRGEKLILGEAGNIQGEVEVKELICAGQIEGRIAAQKIHLQKTAQIKGEVFSQSLSVEEGARLEGQIKVGPEQTRPSKGDQEGS